METPLIPGCNYHIKWANPKMRFILVSFDKGKAIMCTRTTNKKFTTNINDLIFIDSDYNKEKAKQLLSKEKDINNIFKNIKILSR